jgi:hypothetical protein
MGGAQIIQFIRHCWVFLIGKNNMVFVLIQFSKTPVIPASSGIPQIELNEVHGGTTIPQ